MFEEKFALSFNLFDHSFCEYEIYGQSPEIINSISSLFLVFFGIFGIIKNKNINDINIINSSMIVNGITSFLYHFTNKLGWGLMDRFSMILLIIQSLHIFLEILKFNLFYKELFRLGILFYISYILTITGLHQENLFNIFFGVYLINLFMFMIYLEIKNKTFLIPKNIMNKGWYGIFFITIAGVFWILTEQLCNSYSFVKYLFGHAIWHFGVSYGGYLLTLIPSFLFQKDRFLKLEYYYFIPYIKLIY